MRQLCCTGTSRTEMSSLIFPTVLQAEAVAVSRSNFDSQGVDNPLSLPWTDRSWKVQLNRTSAHCKDSEGVNWTYIGVTNWSFLISSRTSPARGSFSSRSWMYKGSSCCSNSSTHARMEGMGLDESQRCLRWMRMEQNAEKPKVP